jgi:hypothetical protein
MLVWSLLIGIGSTLIAPGTTAEDFGTICHKNEDSLVAKTAETHQLFDSANQKCGVRLVKKLGMELCTDR